MSGSALVPRLVVAAIAATIAFQPGLDSWAGDGRRIVIEIRGFQFRPQRPAVEPGDLVVWRNRDIVPHTVTAADATWDSGLVEAGAEWQTVMTEDMLGAYYCRFHPSMVGALVTRPD